MFVNFPEEVRGIVDPHDRFKSEVVNGLDLDSIKLADLGLTVGGPEVDEVSAFYLFIDMAL